jgi:hypothetical protein
VDLIWNLLSFLICRLTFINKSASFQLLFEIFWPGFAWGAPTEPQLCPSVLSKAPNPAGHWLLAKSVD